MMTSAPATPMATRNAWSEDWPEATVIAAASCAGNESAPRPSARLCGCDGGRARPAGGRDLGLAADVAVDDEDAQLVAAPSSVTRCVGRAGSRCRSRPRCARRVGRTSRGGVSPGAAKRASATNGPSISAALVAAAHEVGPEVVEWVRTAREVHGAPDAVEGEEPPG
jgi:hypothetical protein